MQCRPAHPTRCPPQGAGPCGWCSTVQRTTPRLQSTHWAPDKGHICAHTHTHAHKRVGSNASTQEHGNRGGTSPNGVGPPCKHTQANKHCNSTRAFATAAPDFCFSSPIFSKLHSVKRCSIPYVWPAHATATGRLAPGCPHARLHAPTSPHKPTHTHPRAPSHKPVASPE
jgi:hypothetical protein